MPVIIIALIFATVHIIRASHRRRCRRRPSRRCTVRPATVRTAQPTAAQLERAAKAAAKQAASERKKAFQRMQAADDLMNVVGIKASFVCCKVGEKVHISARSFGDINVQRIMEKLGGGGHLTVSGAQLRDCTEEGAKDMIRKAIEEYLEEETV